MTELNNRSHLAGIVPVAGQKLNFNFPWHDCLNPIAENYLAIERSVFECAVVGCNTIWISCPYDMQPLLRYRLGDYVLDPVFRHRKNVWKQPMKKIPIYYIPINPRDQDKRDSLVWSILHGMFAAGKISNGLSKWLIPEKYYISFPYGVFPTASLLRQRENIRKSERFFISCNSKNICNDEYLSFTVNSNEFKSFKNIFLAKATGLMDKNSTVFKELNGCQIPMQRLSINDRYSGRFLKVSDIFENMDMNGAFEYKTPWYYRIDSWSGLCEYLGSTKRKLVRRSKINFLKYCELDGTIK